MGEMLDEFIVRDKYTGEKVKYVRRVCKCGHSLYFLENKPMVCSHCNGTVYPTGNYEFKAELEKVRRKKR
jgi:CDGSH-type Zn-finger protein